MEIYLDNSATTQVCPAAVDIALQMMTQGYGNPSSLHRKGFTAERAVTAARQTIGDILHVDAGHIIFTSGGSEANSLAVVGATLAARRQGNKVVTTATEHASIQACVRHLESLGFEVVHIPPGADGRPDPQTIADQVDENTVLVSVSHVGSETGAISDLATIARMIKARNPHVLFHSDCVQSFGRLKIDPKAWGLDLLSASGHKIHAPKGVGFLYVAKGIRITPLTFGAGQERGLHPGTENTPGICAMAVAAKELWQSHQEITSHFMVLNARLRENLSRLKGICINSPPQSAPYIMNFSVPGIPSEVLLHSLEEMQVYISSGSACAKGARSHVLTAMGLPPSRIDSALRISLCRYNTLEEIDTFTSYLEEAICRLARYRNPRTSIQNTI